MRTVLALVGFFLSGAAGLIAEVCWIRRASLVFGSTTFATSSVVAVFFAGLAAGAWLCGRTAPRVGHPLRTYAVLELALAALVVVSPLAFTVADSLWGQAYRAATSAGGWLWLVRVLLVGGVIFVPAGLMGATLPLFCRQFVQSPARIGRAIGGLYALNTAGAALGCAMAGFVLLPAIGLVRTLVVAACTSGVAALLVATSHWNAMAPAPVAPSRDSTPSAAGVAPHRTLVAVLFFATGFVALGHEVLWTRFLALVVPTNVHTYTSSLLVVLVGIVLGSALASLVADRAVATRIGLFGAVQVGAALAALVTVLLPPTAWQAFGSATRTALVLALVPAALSGAAFPLAVRLVARGTGEAARVAGSLAAANTFGGIAGALCVGFVALPRLGLARSALLVTGIGVAAGCAAWVQLDRGSGARVRRALAVVAAVAAWFAIPRLLPTRVPADFLADRATLVDFHEGLESNLAVVRKQGTLQLEVDRWWQGQERKTHQIMAAHVPMLVHPAPRRVLVVGVGAGQTPERVLLYDIERLDCVDIEPAVFELVRRHFSSAWMQDPRVRLVRADGRNDLVHGAGRYDVVALEVGQIFRPGAESFYTVDFYRHARRRLEPGGILSQFVPLPFLDAKTFASVLASFLAVFPQSVLWYNTSECLLMGVNGDRFAIDPARLDLLSADAGIHADLRYSHWNGPAYWLHQPAVFLGGFLCGPRGLATLSAGARLLHDDRPVLAYATRDIDAEAANELPLRALVAAQLEPVANVLARPLADSALARAAAVRAHNLADLETSAALRRVDGLQRAGRAHEVEALLRGALRANPENVQANRLLADALFVGGRMPEAEDAYTRTLALDDGDATAHWGLARALHVQRRFAEAVHHYRLGLDLDPTDPDAHNNLAAALAEQGDLEAAARHFRRALELRPEFPDARQNLARLESHLSRSRAATPR